MQTLNLIEVVDKGMVKVTGSSRGGCARQFLQPRFSRTESKLAK